MSFYDGYTSSQSTLAAWAKETYPNETRWEETTFGGQKVIYARNADQSINMDVSPAMQKDGRIHEGE